MAFVTVTDLSCDTTVSLGGSNRKTGKKNPTQVEGYYLGRKKVEDTKKKSGFSYIHVLQTPNGNLGVWGKTNLDQKLENVAFGTMIRATHVGMQPTKNGEMYTYKVEVDKDNTIEVSTPSSEVGQQLNLSADYDDGGQAFGGGDDEEEENPTGFESESFNRPASTVAANKSKVEALLKGKRQ